MHTEPGTTTQNPSHNNRRGSRLKGISLAVLIAALSFVGAGALDAGWLGLRVSPFSPVILAIVFGALIANLGFAPEAWRCGFAFCSKYLLQAGIVALGFRLSLTSAGSIGLEALPLVLTCIAAALLIVAVSGPVMGLPGRLTGLIAVGTSICGCTAIVALAPLIRAKDEEVSYGIAVVAIFGVLAMLCYPWLAHWLFADQSQLAGFFLGTAIHDTAQVAGAALIYADQFLAAEALDVATVTKLVRNLMMVLLLPLMALLYRSPASTDARRGLTFSLLPPFILAFVGMSALRSWGDMTLSESQAALGMLDAGAWQQVISVLSTAAKWLLAIAMAAVGLTTRFSVLRELGLKPFMLGLTAAAAVGLTSLTWLKTFSA
ncbi:MAG: putative sulfate exporter family transporter [Pseudomonadota bacterium]